jgi:hypothetical protein
MGPILRSQVGDIWDFLPTHYVVITTNQGWKVRSGKASAVMGKGLAKDAADRYPELPRLYGEWCKGGKHDELYWYEKAPLILLPVKPLNPTWPETSWRSPASLDLIQASCARLLSQTKRFAQWKAPFGRRPIALCLLGCGAGGLTMEEVRPIMDQYFGGDENFVLVLAEASSIKH